MDSGNYVPRLNEFAQKNRFELKYLEIDCAGPDHNKTFTRRVILNGKAYPDGKGKNKKEAKHNAAKNALKCLLENEHQDSVDSTEDAAGAASVRNINYICWLNEYGQRNRVTIRAVESTKLGPNRAAQCCSFVVGDKEYPTATGERKREAKEEAAKLAYHELCGKKTTEIADENHSSTSNQQTEQLTQNVSESSNKTRHLSGTSKDNSFTVTNYIGIVNHYCQKTNISCKFIEEERRGPPHNLRFFYKVVINNKEYPVAEGKTIMEAKQNAAQRAWSDLQEQSDWNSKNINFNRFTSEFDPMECLGSGAFGHVYKVKHKLLEDKYYAVKIACCEEKSLREVGTLSDLHHPNIIRYYTFWMEDSGYQCPTRENDSYSSSQSAYNSSAKYLYIQMELCDTKTLKVWIEDKNKTLQDPKRREESLSIAQQIVSGVEYIHSKKHIHRDLKRSERNYGRKVDIFALGLIYFELLWNVSTGHERAENCNRSIKNTFLSPACYNFVLQFFIRYIKKAVVNGQDFFIGMGNDEKEAKQNAAKSALGCLNEKENPRTPRQNAEKNPTAPFHQKNILNQSDVRLRKECGQKNRGAIKPAQATSLGPKKAINFVAGDEEYPAITGETKRKAEEEAAKPVHDEICGSKFTQHESVNTGNTTSEKTSAQSDYSRFKSEFESILRLGEGAFGRVFEANEKLTKKRCAVKIVRCKDIQKALREVEALSDLLHCNIIRYYACWLEDSGYKGGSAEDSSSSSQSSTDNSPVKYLYIKLELCNTKTLRGWIDEKNTQDVEKSLQDSKRREESLSIARQIVSGVKYIHSKQLIHRDLKPANIMFGQDGTVKIGDFGLVTAENDEGAENLVERTVYKGTPSYMAPEQKSQTTYDRKVDIYALGLIYFELFWNIPTAHERQTREVDKIGAINQTPAVDKPEPESGSANESPDVVQADSNNAT
ncbi:hypothetical protein L3Q82_001715 [Scortum barcoo]|uniref:Uncharacterized protein n=1 Tax=Scortum barcoo TaxID=214431 RepID=A0ACB8W5B7_9TELE|nr:hypothetical protein L3Q82_001715 [Scortum barcoo]